MRGRGGEGPLSHKGLPREGGASSRVEGREYTPRRERKVAAVKRGDRSYRPRLNHSKSPAQRSRSRKNTSRLRKNKRGREDSREQGWKSRSGCGANKRGFPQEEKVAYPKKEEKETGWRGDRFPPTPNKTDRHRGGGLPRNEDVFPFSPHQGGGYKKWRERESGPASSDGHRRYDNQWRKKHASGHETTNWWVEKRNEAKGWGDETDYQQWPQKNTTPNQPQLQLTAGKRYPDETSKEKGTHGYPFTSLEPDQISSEAKDPYFTGDPQEVVESDKVSGAWQPGEWEVPPPPENLVVGGVEARGGGENPGMRVEPPKWQEPRTAPSSNDVQCLSSKAPSWAKRPQTKTMELSPEVMSAMEPKKGKGKAGTKSAQGKVTQKGKQSVTTQGNLQAQRSPGYGYYPGAGETWPDPNNAKEAWRAGHLDLRKGQQDKGGGHSQGKVSKEANVRKGGAEGRSDRNPYQTPDNGQNKGSQVSRLVPDTGRPDVHAEGAQTETAGKRGKKLASSLKGLGKPRFKPGDREVFDQLSENDPDRLKCNIAFEVLGKFCL